MSRGFSASRGQEGFGAREAFTVQARTYPKVWRDGTVADIDKNADSDKKRFGDYTLEQKVEAFGSAWTEIIPGTVDGAADEAKRISNNVYNALRNELPAHTFNGLAAENKVVERERKTTDGSFTEYGVQLVFESPNGTRDTRFFYVSPKGTDDKSMRAKAEAVLQLIIENGSERREISDGKQTKIEARRRKND